MVPGAADDLLRTLEALGLHWDGDVAYQSRRLDRYQAALDVLVRQGDVYGCRCSRAEVARAASAPHPGDDGPVYPGTCRDRGAGGPVRCYRVKVGTEAVRFVDGLQGPFSTVLAASSGDFVVKRADGPFAYQLAVVVDDAEFGVSQVVRGADLLPSTPRQLHLQRLLTLPTPAYVHLPLVTGPGGEKLSKRDSAVSFAVSPPLTAQPGRLLADCLRFLGQQTPVDLHTAPASECLAWAERHFQLGAVPLSSRPFPAPG